jgi:hypothetical protein
MPKAAMAMIVIAPALTLLQFRVLGFRKKQKSAASTATLLAAPDIQMFLGSAVRCSP